MRTLLPPHQASLAEFIRSPLWFAVRKLCLDERMPETPDVKDPSHVAAAKGHQRAGFEAAFAAIEALPFEKDDTPKGPFDRPAVMITED